MIFGLFDRKKKVWIF